MAFRRTFKAKDLDRVKGKDLVDPLYNELEIIQSVSRRKCMIYPDDKGKIIWDIFIFVLLIFTSIVTPYRLAFNMDEDSEPI